MKPIYLYRKALTLHCERTTSGPETRTIHSVQTILNNKKQAKIGETTWL